jgi:hypothetical protein
MLALRGMQHRPGGCEKNKSAANQHVACDMQETEMRIALDAEDRRPQVPGVVRQRIETRIPALQPT